MIYENVEIKTYNDLRAWLKSYRNVLYWDRLLYLSRAESIKAITYSFEQPGTKQVNPIQDNMLKIDEIERKMKDIEEFIFNCTSFTTAQRYILWERYINNTSFESIADTLNYSQNWVYYQHYRALSNYIKTLE